MTRQTTLDAIAKRYGVALTGQMPIALKAGRADLPKLCKSLGMTSGAEVGVWKGAYSEQFCKAIPCINWSAVDTWAPYAEYREKKNDAALINAAYGEARRRLDPYGCWFLQFTSLKGAECFGPGTLDVVYIDANHEAPFVLDDLRAWTPKVSPGGILAGHDYRDVPAKPFIQVKAAVQQYVKEAGITPWFVLAGDPTPSFLWVIP